MSLTVPAHGVEELRRLRRELRDERSVEAGLSRLEEAVPRVLRDVRRRLEDGAAELSAAIESKARPEVAEVRRRADALRRAEARLADRVEEITRSDASVQRKLERVRQAAQGFEATVEEVARGMEEFEHAVRSVRGLSREEQKALLLRGQGALFAGFADTEEHPRIEEKPHVNAAPRQGHAKRRRHDEGPP